MKKIIVCLFIVTVLVLVNKADNKERQNNLYNFYELGFEDMIAISAEHNIGFDKLNSYLESNIYMIFMN